jgi:hypothetical protein
MPNRIYSQIMAIFLDFLPAWPVCAATALIPAAAPAHRFLHRHWQKK